MESLFPTLAYLRVRKLLQVRRAQEPDTRATWRQRLNADEEAIEMAAEIYDAESERITGLEQKLRSTLGYVTPFVPLAAAAVVVSIDPFQLGAFVLGLLAAFQLLGAYLVTLTGTEARETHMVTNEALENVLAESDKPAAWAAEKLWASERNRWVGIDLNNAIWVVNVSLARVVVLLVAAAAVLFLGH